MFTIEGKIIEVSPEKKTTKASFKEVILETKENYPQRLKFTIKFNKYTEEIFDIITVGTETKISFNISGNEWQGKHYVQLNAWKVEVQRSGSQNQRKLEQVQEQEFNDDLPF
jgi:hypothetical protein